MCRGRVLGLVVRPLSAFGVPLGATVVRFGVVMVVLVLVVVGGSDCVTGASSGCRSAVVAVVGSVAAGAETAVCHANATRSGGQFGDPICNGVTRIAFLQNDSDFPGTYLFIPDPFLIAPGSDNGPKATNGE